jgi:hypothetical protein
VVGGTQIQQDLVDSRSPTEKPSSQRGKFNGWNSDR